MAKALRTTTFNEPKAVTDVLKGDLGSLSREAVTILSGSGILAIGTVLAKVAASGKYVPAIYDTEEDDGSQLPVAVLIDAVDATSADVTRAIVVHRLAEVSRQGLVWAASYDNGTKIAAGIAALALNTILVRDAS